MTSTVKQFFENLHIYHDECHRLVKDFKVTAKEGGMNMPAAENFCRILNCRYAQTTAKVLEHSQKLEKANDLVEKCESNEKKARKNCDGIEEERR